MLWLPNEVLADIFKFLPRSELANSVQPSNRRLNAICEQKVDNVHIISEFSDFLRELAENSPEANNHLATLAGSECNLGTHFRLDHREEVEIRRRLQKQQLVLRCCRELFRFCKLRIQLSDDPDDVAVLDQYLTIIRPLRPQQVDILGVLNVLRCGQLLCHPVVMDCPRVIMYEAVEGDSTPLEIFRWLHHPIVVEDEETVLQTRLLNVMLLNFERGSWKLFAEHCSQHFFASTSPTDRRPFVLSFGSDKPDLNSFKFTNSHSGEVLMFGPEDIPLISSIFYAYRFRRCPIAEATEAATQQFYGQAFDDLGDFRFTEEDRARGAGVKLVLC